MKNVPHLHRHSLSQGITLILVLGSLGLGLLSVRTSTAQLSEPSRYPNVASAAKTSEDGFPGRMAIPDVVLVDQDGRQVHFYQDLVRNKVVVMNFVFTTCTTVCPLMGANFAKLQQLMGDRVGRDFFMISISIDPVTDTPQRLKAWSRQFNAAPGWTLLTGQKNDVDSLLKALGVFTADKLSHSAIVLLGNDSTGEWTRTSGLAAPAKLADIIDSLGEGTAQIPVPQPVTHDQHFKNGPAGLEVPSGQDSASHRYFGDITLLNQDGEKMQLYSDLLKDKVVVIDSFFSSCQGSCPVMTATLARIQDWLGSRLGREAYLISISVDPETDTPARLKACAEQVNAKPGWYFLTGKKEDVNLALAKLGQFVERKEDHLNIMIIGNERTGLWKKVFGLAKAEDIIKVVESVLNDRG
jgi:protein SCO1